MIAYRIDIAVFMLDEVDEGLGATNIGEESAVDDFVFAVGFFIFATFEPFVSLFDDVTGRFLEKKGFDAGGKLVGVMHAIRGVIFVEKEELNRDVVFDFVELVCPMKNVEIASRWGWSGSSSRGLFR